MKLGMIVRADNTGLGVQSHSFYKHMKPHKTMVVDISNLNGNKQYYERYKKPWRIVKGFPTDTDCDEFLDGIDALFTFEIPYNYYLFERANELGVKTFLHYNYEFLDYLQRPELPRPTTLLSPSAWGFADVANRGLDPFLMISPTDTKIIKPRTIKRAKTFVHLVGKPAVHDRNGTDVVIKSLEHITADINIIFRCQNQKYLDDLRKTIRESAIPLNVNVEFRGEVEHYSQNYDEGDVMLIPRKYGGMCLPMQEALASGMPVIMTDVSPNNTRLPLLWLVPAKHVGTFMTRTEIDIWEANPRDLAMKIDWFAGLNEEDMTHLNNMALDIGETYSWKNMLPQYQSLLRWR